MNRPIKPNKVPPWTPRRFALGFTRFARRPLETTLDHPDKETVMTELSNTDSVAKALSGLLNDGDSYVVECKGGVVSTRPLADKDYLKIKYPELHGSLHKCEQKLIGTGGQLWIIIIIGLILNLAIANDWLGKIDIDTTVLKSWWFYTAVVIGMFVVNNIYLKYKADKNAKIVLPEITRSLEENGISMDKAISLLTNDNALYNVRQCLMK
jgi:uncharacterized membrane protein (DUF485 family)